MQSWGVAEAKARFSEVIASARQGEVQQITRNGKLVGLVVSPEEWEKKTRPTPAQNARTTADFLRQSPLRGSGIDLTRSRSKARKVAL
ncbi:MAG: type II toxin-antitoxin system Phd/YefM family antitoxin [Candidatus Acidiferrales bacterium]